MQTIPAALARIAADRPVAEAARAYVAAVYADDWARTDASYARVSATRRALFAAVRGEVAP